MAISHFLITDRAKDDEREYFNQTIVKTNMTWEEMTQNNHNGWEPHFLSWQFGGVQEEDDNGDIWSDHRIVCIYDLKAVPEEDVPVLDKYLSTFDLDQIIKDEIEESEA